MDILKEFRPQLEILDRVVIFEKKVEFHRFLIVLTFAGYISIMGGFIEYICYRILGVDATFFILQATNIPELSISSEPILFISIWLFYLLPFVSLGIYIINTHSIILWNRAYRSIAMLISILFLITHLCILLIGIDNQIWIPSIWGIVVGSGFILAGHIFYSETNINLIRLSMFIYGSFSILLGLSASIILPLEISMFMFCLIFGLILILLSIFLRINLVKVVAVSKEK